MALLGSASGEFLLCPRNMHNLHTSNVPFDERRARPRKATVMITSLTSDAALRVLVLVLATHLRIKHDFWVDPVPSKPPFVMRLRADLPQATLATLRASVSSIADTGMG